MARDLLLCLPLLLTAVGCTEPSKDIEIGYDNPPPSPSGYASTSPSRAPGFDLAPSTFNRVHLCGPAVTQPNSSDGRGPCRIATDPDQVQRLQAGLLAATPTAYTCPAGARRLELTLADTTTVGLRPASLEATVDCLRVRRLGSDRYFAVSPDTQRLILEMATATS